MAQLVAAIKRHFHNLGLGREVLSSSVYSMASARQDYLCLTTPRSSGLSRVYENLIQVYSTSLSEYTQWDTWPREPSQRSCYLEDNVLTKLLRTGTWHWVQAWSKGRLHRLMSVELYKQIYAYSLLANLLLNPNILLNIRFTTTSDTNAETLKLTSRMLNCD